MWPCQLQDWLVLLWIERLSCRINLRWNRSKEIRSKLTLSQADSAVNNKIKKAKKHADDSHVHTRCQGHYHADNFWIYRLRDNFSVVGDIVENFGQGLSFDLLALQFRGCVIEVEHDRTLPDLS